ncbi:3-oxoacyl-ACP synthase [Klebsiella pneumoniae]|uniref:3-oxoacyl-ACP synthase n=1 Tax=Klebsiella pneumoniae TaxID=573 RepID=A0A378F5Z7_KLEPN|nr:3-oxoacyl-ACP synthase [Klebsiella pneumoniae]
MGVSVKRIVVTGMGLSARWAAAYSSLQSLLAGKSGVTRLSEQLVGIFLQSGRQVPSIDSDPLHGFDPLATIPAKERKKMDRLSSLRWSPP